MSVTRAQFEQARTEGAKAAGPGYNGQKFNPYAGGASRLLARAWLDGWTDELEKQRAARILKRIEGG